MEHCSTISLQHNQQYTNSAKASKWSMYGTLQLSTRPTNCLKMKYCETIVEEARSQLETKVCVFVKVEIMHM